MVESREKRDILSDSRIAYIGDDTGLIKKVKIVAKRIEETTTTAYDVRKRSRNYKEGVERPKPTFVYTRPNTLGATDN